MGRCSICNHAERTSIEEALLRRTPLRDIADRWPGISKTALNRHLHDHLAPTPRFQEVSREQALAEKSRTEHHGALLLGLRANTIAMLTEARERGDLRAGAALARVVKDIFELLWKMRCVEQAGGLVIQVDADTLSDGQLAAIAAGAGSSPFGDAPPQ